jgi:hypothetical protein
MVWLKLAYSFKRRNRMAKFLVAFYGGKMAATPAEQKKSMDDWTKWFIGLGKSVCRLFGACRCGY